MALEFEGKVALVTGAGGGLGRAHALALAERGVSVVINDLGTSVTGEGHAVSTADGVVEEITNRGGIAVSNADSVSDVTGCNRMVASALEVFGRLDIVVNNAGILDEAPLAQTTSDHVRRVIDTHLIGTMNVIRASWKELAESGAGRIVNTSSGAVFGSVAGTAYQAAKAGIVAVTKSMAIAGESVGIKVNAILPTAYTRMTASIPEESFREFMRETFGPERVAELVVVLAHESCPVSGECVLAGGGRIARLALAVTEGYISDIATAEDYRTHLDEALDSQAMFVPKDRADEFASYLGKLGYAHAEVLRGGALSSGNQPDAHKGNL
jgi:NAD(P)-dependent dehydrogenase (short-subunit alcohol dehydrogenase family)